MSKIGKDLEKSRGDCSSNFRPKPVPIKYASHMSLIVFYLISEYCGRAWLRFSNYAFGGGEMIYICYLPGNRLIFAAKVRS